MRRYLQLTGECCPLLLAKNLDSDDSVKQQKEWHGDSSHQPYPPLKQAKGDTALPSNSAHASSETT